MDPSRVIPLVLMLFGFVLHTFTWVVMASSFSLGFWLLSLSPYIASALLYFAFGKPHAAAGAVILPAVLDAGAYYWAFVDTHGDMGGLGLLVIPIWNIVFLVPIGAGIGWWVGQRATTKNMLSNKSLERTREG
jgi:hypothetical protein